MEVILKQNNKISIDQLPSKVEDIKYGVTISELEEVVSKVNISAIMFKYLANNVKGKGILEPSQIDMVVDFILLECKNLQIEEINLIFKNGVLGRYGVIYNDISIDTICGLNGWIESYYMNDRKKRSESPNIKDPVYNGKEMTYEEYLSKYPNVKKQLRIKELKKLLSSKNATILNVIEYCELLGHDWEQKKEKLLLEYDKFEHKEMLNFDQWCIVFIKSKIK